MVAPQGVDWAVRRIKIDSIAPGMKIAKPIYDEIGRVLVAEGAELTERIGQALEGRGISALMIEDEESAGIEIFDVVTERTRSVAMKSVTRVHEVIKATSSAGPASKGGDDDDPESAAENVNRDVENIIDEILDTEMLEGMSLLQGTSDSELNIGVDTAVVAIVIGKKLFFERRLLRIVAAGSMLHDVGLSEIDAGLASKSEKRMSEREHATFQTHARAGFKIVRSLFPTDPLIAQVALQHHERQDGSGFPRGLEGNNKVLKTAAERTSGKYITTTSEVAQVARRFAELSSGASSAGALPPETVVATMAEESGVLLNAEVVKRFLQLAPPFPVGIDVVFTEGKLKGFRGIVAEVRPHNRDRPVVRLLRDAQGKATKRIHIELWKYPDFQISSRVD